MSNPTQLIKNLTLGRRKVSMPSSLSSPSRRPSRAGAETVFNIQRKPEELGEHSINEEGPK